MVEQRSCGEVGGDVEAGGLGGGGVGFAGLGRWLLQWEDGAGHETLCTDGADGFAHWFAHCGLLL